jgi:hypothetical protein
MPFGGPKKPLTEMTRREIYSMLIAFTVIGGFIIAMCVRDLVVRDRGTMAVLSVADILFILMAVGVTCVRAIRELRRRQRV